jgi:cathepsin L
MRKKIFEDKLQEVMEFNKQGASYKKGINHLSDWTVAERQALNGNIPQGKVERKSKPLREHTRSGLSLPHSVDWRNVNPPVLSSVKDQGMCGSCWAHAATESIETHTALATGKLFVLSQQQITSCTPNPNSCGGTGGCAGATAELAFDYVVGAGGITEEWMYSYQSYFGVTPGCAFNASKTVPVASITGYVSVPRNDAGAVMDALAHHGPLAISVQANTWGDYEAGVFTGCNYAHNISMDHAVQLVGYGHDGDLGLDYWLVRNSWSPAWGEDGYIRLERHMGTPYCGWNVDWDTNGGGCTGQPNTVWACGTCGILYDTLYPVVDGN